MTKTNPDQPSVPSPERIAEIRESVERSKRDGDFIADPEYALDDLLRALDVATEERDRLRAQTAWQGAADEEMSYWDGD